MAKLHNSDADEWRKNWGTEERFDELFAGIASSIVVKSLLSVASKPDYGVMLLGVKCAFRYDEMHKSGYIQLDGKTRDLGMG